MVAHPDGKPCSEMRFEQRHVTHGPPDVVLAIGPEGGFSADEIIAAEQGRWQIVSLGPRILRIETAAVSLAAKFSLG